MAQPLTYDTGERWFGIGVALALHLAVGYALLQLESVRRAVTDTMPVMVRFIAPPQPEPPPVVEPPKPKPKPKPEVRPVTAKSPPPPPPPPIITAPRVDTPAPLEAPEPPKPAPLPPIEVPVVRNEAPAPAAIAPPTAAPVAQVDKPVAAPPVAAPPAPPAPPPPVVPPSFSAGYLLNPPPPYPLAARRLGEQGKVLLRVYVNASGAAERIDIATSSGSARLDQSALDTVRLWRFVPARQGEQPVPAWVDVPIVFSLGV